MSKQAVHPDVFKCIHHSSYSLLLGRMSTCLLSSSRIIAENFLACMQELGLDCVAWAPAVYHDLLRSGDGTAEGIVAAYFGMVSAASS